MVAILPVEEMTENVIAVYRSATSVQRFAGMTWYEDANRVANSLAFISGYSLDQCAGVIAAVSPLNSWGHNVVLAERIINAHGNVFAGYLKKNLAKARSILIGTSVWEELRANKTRAFFEAIRTNGETDIVCVDRHAYSLAVNRRATENSLSITDKQYEAISSAYRAAAIRLGIPAAKLQAITWVVWRQRYWAEGAFDGK